MQTDPDIFPALDTPTINLILADDEVIVRAGIRKLLDEIKNVRVLAEASDGRELIELVEIHQPNVVLIDVMMPELNGIDATERIKRQWPHIAVIVLSGHTGSHHIQRAFSSGANGYIGKRSSLKELESAIQSAALGKSHIGKLAHHNQFLTNRKGRQSLPLEQLTNRQREILQLISEGHTSIAIAQKLGLKQKTVETHRAQLMQRLNIRGVAGLVRYAIQNELVDVEKSI